MTASDASDAGAYAADIDVNAPPERVYALVADITRMGEWSPECVRCRWIGPERRPTPGARFRGTSRNGWRRWSTVSTVIVADPGRSFAFAVTYFGLPVATWRYELRPTAGGGTHLIESVEDRRGPFLRRLSPLITGSSDRGRRNTETMASTLVRVKDAAERL